MSRKLDPAKYFGGQVYDLQMKIYDWTTIIADLFMLLATVITSDHTPPQKVYTQSNSNWTTS